MEAYVLCLAQMSISFLFDGHIKKFKEFANEFFDKNSELKHAEMEMEMLMLAGFINEFIGESQMAKHYYTKGFEQATLLNKDFYKALCLSNIGIIDANSEMNDLFDNLEIEEDDERENDLQEIQEDNMEGEDYYEGKNVIDTNQNDLYEDDVGEGEAADELPPDEGEEEDPNAGG